LAKLVNGLEQAEESSLAAESSAAHLNLTLQGQMIGTPGYMSPEQAAGRPELVDRRTDIYGLGAILYEILTGRPPFTGSDTEELLRRVRQEEPLLPSRVNPDVPAVLEKICRKAIRKTASDRYGSPTDLAQEVQLWQDLERRKAEQLLEQFFTLSRDLFCVGGFDGYFKRVNPAWERTLGYTSAEMLQHPWLHFIHPDDQESTVAAAKRLVAAGSVIPLRNRYRHKDGTYRWLSWLAMPIIEEQLIYASARDVTEFVAEVKRTEELLEQRSRELEEARLQIESLKRLKSV